MFNIIKSTKRNEITFSLFKKIFFTSLGDILKTPCALEID